MSIKLFNIIKNPPFKIVKKPPFKIMAKPSDFTVSDAFSRQISHQLPPGHRQTQAFGAKPGEVIDNCSTAALITHGRFFNKQLAINNIQTAANTILREQRFQVVTPGSNLISDFGMQRMFGKLGLDGKLYFIDGKLDNHILDLLQQGKPAIVLSTSQKHFYNIAARNNTLFKMDPINGFWEPIGPITPSSHPNIFSVNDKIMI